jgi:hypothetical protein
VTRGKVILRTMPVDWQQTGAGMAELINDLPTVLRKRFPKEKCMPKTIFSDRGPGFYQASAGTIVAACKEALVANAFKPWAGYESKWQPPDMPDIMPHETAVAWVRKFMRGHPFKATKKVEENVKFFKDLLAQCEKHINQNYDVTSLYNCFPRRIKALIDAKGDRLRY